MPKPIFEIHFSRKLWYDLDDLFFIKHIIGVDYIITSRGNRMFSVSVPFVMFIVSWKG